MAELRNIIILGGGPAGLATGHEVSTHGGKVTVLERNDYVGGLCRTIHMDGYRFDLGGHRWFTKNEDLNEWFKRLMAGEIVMVNRISRIYYDRKYFYYPIQVGDIFRKAGPVTIVHAGLAFLWAMLRQAISNKAIVNMKEAYTAQFGSKLYDMFFRRYSEKVWGRPCEELSADWVSQRSKGLSIWTVVQEALLGGKNDKNLSTLIDQFMYPRYGYMRIPERMAEDIRANNGDVTLGATVTGIEYKGPNRFTVRYKKGDEEHSVDGDAVVSSIPLGILARILVPGGDENVRKAAQGLEFRDLITVNVMLKRRQVSRDTWLYIQDSDVLFGRLHEPKNWSPDMVPDDEHTSLVLECFCSRGDHIWNMSDEEIKERCIRDLVDKLHFVEEEEYCGAHVIRTREAYPVYDLEYADKIATVKNFLATFEGLHIAGRGGTFRYNNSDHSIEMGLLLGQKLLGHDVDYMAVNTEEDYHEIKTHNEPKRDRYQFRQSGTE